MAVRKNDKHYVDNETFTKEVVKYNILLKEHEENGLGRPRMPAYLGDCFKRIAEKYSNHPYFIGYPFKDEMIQDGILTCIKYIHKFDPNVTNNAFAYFTRAIYFSFRQRIMREKKYLYTKFKSIENAEVFEGMSFKQEHDDSYYIQDIGYSEEARENMNEFIETYEKTQGKK